MEHIICHTILDHLNTYNIINPIQHGFRSGLSCQTQLILLIDEIVRAMDQHYQVDLIVLDFSKVFDTIKIRTLRHSYSQILTHGYKHGLLKELRRSLWRERRLRL